MGSSNTFEFAFGEEIIDLVTNECQDGDQVNTALTKLATAPGTYQLPTPPPSPSPLTEETNVHSGYISPRWPKRFKLPLTVLTPGNIPSMKLSPLERLPCDVLWLILSPVSSTYRGQPLLDQNDHISLLLTSKTMAVRYFALYHKSTTTLEHSKLLVLDRISAPQPRRHHFSPSCTAHLEAQAELSEGHSATPDLKRSRSQLDSADAQIHSSSPIAAAREDLDTDEPDSKRRKTVDP